MTGPTHRQPASCGAGLTWPMVALCAIVVGALVAIFYLGDATARTAILAVVTGASTAVMTVITTRRIGQMRDQLDQVHHVVNGNTARLIDKIPEPDRPSSPPYMGNDRQHRI